MNSSKTHFLFAILLLLSVSAWSQQPQPILFQDVSYFHSPSQSFKKGSVLVENGKVKSIGKQSTVAGMMEVVNGKGKYLIPGLTDAHIHLFQSGGLYTRPDALDLTSVRSYDEERTWLKEHAGELMQRYLRLGITTLIDVGGPLSNFEIRDQFQESNQHPNLFLTGPLISTYQPKAFEIEDAPIIKAHSVEEAIELVRAQLPHQPDFIKIWYIDLPDQSAASTYDIVEATIKEAHSHQLKVAVHATQLATAKLALKAGADILVHSVDDPLDKEFISTVKKRGVVYIPTLVVHGNYRRVFGRTYVPSKLDFLYADPFTLGSLYDARNGSMEEIFSKFPDYMAKSLPKHEEHVRNQLDNLKLLQKEGIVVATGTDAGNIGTLHASSYFDELAAMAKSGLSNGEILLASTLGGAKTVDKESELGSIDVGKNADLVLLNANPLEDIQNLSQVAMVVKGGEKVNLDKLAAASPEELAQQQLNGYNARDIDAFLAPYAEDVEIYSFPGELESKGKDKMREQYAGMFERVPDLHCELVNRIVEGNTVIDHEWVTISKERPLIKAIAIYKIENGKIAKVYFVQ